MDSYTLKLYKKYLYNDISNEEFVELRYGIFNTKDETLSKQMETEWSNYFANESFSMSSKEQIKKKLDFYIENDIRIRKRRRSIGIAAAIIPLIFISSLFLYNTFSPKAVNDFSVSVDKGNKAKITLPDNTKVWMNSNSTIAYACVKNKREVKLTGEAFFKVAELKNKVFIVEMNDLQIEVLGTSFNAKSRTYSDFVELMLIEGSVKIGGADLPQNYYLQPKEKAIYNRVSKKIEIVKSDDNQETAWKENRLRFNSNRFGDAMAMLEDWYGIRIINQIPEIEDDLISGSFNNESLETVLDAFKMQYNIDYTMDKDKVIILKIN